MTYSATLKTKSLAFLNMRLCAAIGAAVLLIVSYLIVDIQWLEKNTSLSALFAARGAIAAPEDVVIVSLNSAAAERLGYSRYSYTWPRTVYADLLEQLQETQARLVVMDIAFKDPRSEYEDAAFAQALQSFPNTILYTYLKRHQIPTLHGTVDVEQEIPPIERFDQHALASGFFILPKANGKLFSTPLFLELSSGTRPSQPVLAYLALQARADQDRLWQALIGRRLDPDLALVQRAQKLFEHVQNHAIGALAPQLRQLYQVFQKTEPMLINFYGPPRSLNQLDIDRVLQMAPSELRQWFDGKVVYVGYLETWQTEQQDAYTSIYTSSEGVDISGVEISATVLSNLLHQQYIRAIPWYWQLLIALACFALCNGLYRLPTKWNAVMQVSLITALLLFSYLAFVKFYWWLPFSMALLSISMANGIQLTHFYRLNRRRLSSLRYTLAQYLPQEAAHQLSQDMMSLEKQFQVVSGVALMSDIRGYTRLSENTPPEELHSLMNQYYEALVTQVKKHGGFVANIVGDSLLALWTAPKINAELCLKALSCAEEIQQNIAADEKIASLLPTCIALHGGQFSLGNLGASGHYEYSPVGDIINTTSRIEHFNRDLGTDLLISEIIAKQLQETSDTAAKCRYLGAFNMRNKAAAIPLYTEQLKDQQHNRCFEQAIELFQKHQFIEAKALFEKIQTHYNDGPSQYYLKACNQQLASKAQAQTE